MRRFVVLTVGGVLLTALAMPVAAAPAKDVSTPAPQTPLGLQNSKKAMQYRIERDKKVSEVRKQAQAKKHRAQR